MSENENKPDGRSNTVEDSGLAADLPSASSYSQIVFNQHQELPRLDPYVPDDHNEPIREEFKDHHPTADTQPPGSTASVVFQIGDRVRQRSRPGSASVALREAQELVVSEIASKDQRISALEALVNEKDAKTRQLEGELSQVIQEKEAVEEKLKAKDQEISSLATKLQEKEETIQQSKVKLSHAEKEKERMKKHHDAEIKKLKKELASTNSDHNKTVLDLTNEKHQLELELKDMVAKQKDLECDIHKAKRESADLKAELALERQRIAEERHRNSEERARKLEEEKVQSDAKLKEKEEEFKEKLQEEMEKNRELTRLLSEASLNSQISTEPSLGSQASMEND